MADYDDYDEKPERDVEEEGFHDSSEESDDEGQDNYEPDDFIVDDIEEEDGGPDRPLGPRDGVKQEDDEEIRHVKRKKKKKRKHYREDDLADDDIKLLEESGFRVNNKQKRLKRLKRSAPDDDQDREELNEDIRNLREHDVEDDDNFEERRRRADEPVDFDDDMDDFIDDGGRGNRRRRAGPGFVSSEAVRTARSIFGDIDEITQYQGTQGGTGGGDDEADEDYVVGRHDRPHRRSDSLNDEDPSRSRRTESAAADKAIAKGLATSTDDKENIKKIVDTDIPERLQYHFGSNSQPPTEGQIRDEANWIYSKGFLENPKFLGNPHYQSDELVDKIVVLLSYIHIDKLDIPFIAMYRQDYISSLLVPNSGELFRSNPEREEVEPTPMAPPRGFNSILYEDYAPGLSFDHLRGTPRGYDDGFGDWSILWLVLDLDKKYANLTRRRNGLLDAVEDARKQGVPSSVLDDVRTLAHSCDDEKDLRNGERHLRLAIELANCINQDDLDDDTSRRSKRPTRRRNRYTEFIKKGYRKVTKEMGINARQFGENLKGVCDYGAGSQVHVPLDSESDPRESAKSIAIQAGDIISEQLIDRVLSAARYILVTEIVTDLAVLEATRQILFRPGAVTISTKPTSQGIAEVDDTHPLRCITSLSEKKIEDFKGSADFALIRRAVELGFTSLEITFRADQVRTFQKHLEASIVVDSSTSNFVSQWNEQRIKVTEDVHKLLMKTMIAKVRDDLEEETSQVLRHKLMNAASRRFMLGPARLPNDNGTPRVLAFCVTSEDDEEPDAAQDTKDAEDAHAQDSGSKRRIARERITIIELDENGEYCNCHEMFAAWLRRPMRRDLPDNRPPKTVRDELKSIILRSKPQTIVIGVGSGQRTPTRLYDDLVDIIDEMVREKTPPAFLEGQHTIKDAIRTMPRNKDNFGGRPSSPVEDPHTKIADMLSKFLIYVDEAPCRIYAKSKWSSAGLSVDGMTLLERRTIGIGRLAQEPLWVYCGVGSDKELASRLQFHKYHFYANQTDRRIALTRALIRAVCAVGVDVNRSLRLPHTQSLMSHVGGLGTHKANALLKRLGNVLVEEERGLMSRKDLWSQKHIGRIVFLSAAAFLRVRDPELHPGGSTKRAIEFRRQKLFRRNRNGRRREDDDSILFDPRDDSRVHPEHYMVAGKIADESLRDDHGGLNMEIPPSDEYSEELRITAAVLDKPDGLGRLDLQQYATHLADLGRGNLFETVKMIADEFRGPFHDYRLTLRNPEPEALFYLVTGADPVLFRIGSLVTATNCMLRKGRNPKGGAYAGVSCFMPMNLRGFIQIKDFSDDSLADEDIEKLVPNGSSLSARILEFEFSKFEAKLSSKVSFIEDPIQVPQYQMVVDKTDAAFRPYPKKSDLHGMLGIGGAIGSNGAGGITKDLAIQKRLMQRRKTMDHLRMNSKTIIQHPLFRNIDGDQATVDLRSALPGEILLRPSQYDKDDIVISCKFASISELESRTLLHIPCKIIGDDENVENGNEDDGGIRYKIGKVSFEHIDQALDEYVRPILSNLSEAIDYKKFREGSVEELSKYILTLKQKEPKTIPYCFGLSENCASGLILVFVPGSKTVVTEEILVVPNGYKFRNRLHVDMETLVNWFKGNMRREMGVGVDGKGDPKRRPGGIRTPVHRTPMGAGMMGNNDMGYAPGGAGYGSNQTGRIREGISGMGINSGARSPAPYQSPYHAPPRSPFIGAGGNTASTAPVSNMRSGMGSGNQNMGGGGIAVGVAPVRDSAPPPAPVGGDVGSRNPGRYGGYENGRASHAPPSHSQAPNSYVKERPDWSRATQQRDEPPPVPMAPMGRGVGGGGADRSMGMPHQNGGRPGPPSSEGSERPQWRGQAPVPAWKKKQMEKEEAVRQQQR